MASIEERLDRIEARLDGRGEEFTREPAPGEPLQEDGPRRYLPSRPANVKAEMRKASDEALNRVLGPASPEERIRELEEVVVEQGMALAEQATELVRQPLQGKPLGLWQRVVNELAMKIKALEGENAELRQRLEGMVEVLERAEASLNAVGVHGVQPEMASDARSVVAEIRALQGEGEADGEA